MTTEKTTAWLFPGQGAQQVGMGKEIADASPAARAVFEQADAAFAEYAPDAPRLSKLCFEGPSEELQRTANLQPALVATSAAIVAAYREKNPDAPPPAAAAGHSLGEYSALIAAGVLELRDAIRLCRRRGEAMQLAVPEGLGAMAAIVGLEPQAVSTLCADAAESQVVSPANFNGHTQIVIAGHAEAVGRASKLATERGGKAIPLKVSAPFHCALMGPAAEKMKLELDTTTFHSALFPVVANVDARPNDDPGRVADLLLRQIEAPVRWVETVECLAGLGVTAALELGPGKVLAGLIKRIDKTITVRAINSPAALVDE